MRFGDRDRTVVRTNWWLEKVEQQTEKGEDMNTRELEKRIEKIIDSNCIEHPWEGTEVYKQNIKDEVMGLIQEITDEINGKYEYDPVKEMRQERDRKICG